MERRVGLEPTTSRFEVEVSALFTTARGRRSAERICAVAVTGCRDDHRLRWTTSQEQAMTETRSHFRGPDSALTSELPASRRTGFEPVTSGVAGEVTVVFTTARGCVRRGTGDAVAALGGSCRCFLGALGFNEVTDILTHRLAVRRSPDDVDGLLGNGRYQRSVTPTQVIRETNNRTRDSTAFASPPPRYVTPRAGFEPATPWYEGADTFTTSSSRPRAAGN